MYSLLLLALVLGMGATVLAFAARSLRHEPYRSRFMAVGGALVATGAVLAVTGDLVVLAIAWVATSVLAVELIRTGPEMGVAARSLRARRSFVAGDLAMIAAVAVLVESSGGTAIDGIGEAGTGALALAGVLVVIAAAARSASGPFYRWLPDSLGAPTPSSALLHAGVVNGGAIVLIKLAPATTESWVAAVAAVAIGGLTCIFAEAVMLTRPDVKGRLAWSTIAQMSFTMLLCGLGLHLAAGLHLVAHGLYKGALFLGSGTAVRAIVRHRSAPLGDARIHPGAWLAVSVPVLVVDSLVDGFDANLAIPTFLGWIAAGSATQAWLRRAGTRREQLSAVATGTASLAAFLLVTLALKALVGDDLAVDDPALSPLLVVPVLTALVGVALAPRDLAVWAYIRAAGRPTAAPRFQLPGPLAWRPDPIAVLEPAR
jgi:NADH:ubiquinone oxidoreductase subunit 5 (subunit L)/multisubunit Na+/H+ antiporter MnhA subunit